MLILHLSILLYLSLIAVDYTSNEVPVKVEMEAYSPKIPLNSKDSGIPVIIFNFTVTNSTTKDATVSTGTSLTINWCIASFTKHNNFLT